MAVPGKHKLATSSLIQNWLTIPAGFESEQGMLVLQFGRDEFHAIRNLDLQRVEND